MPDRYDTSGNPEGQFEPGSNDRVLGRLSRLLANVMALQAGQPFLDFTYMDENKEAYFGAVQAGLDNAEPMKLMFRQVLHDSQQGVGG